MSADFFKDKFYKLTLFIAVLGFLSLPLITLRYLGYSVELSDTGHYYNAITGFQHIESMSTQFFLIWAIFPTPDTLYSSRLFMFLYVALASFIFCRGLRAIDIFIDLPKWPALLMQLFIFCSLFIFYYFWIPDPSYNIIGYALMVAISGFLFLMIGNAQNNKPKINNHVYAVISGFLLAALTLCRPLTALILLIACVALYLINTKFTDIPGKLKLLIAGVIGGLLCFLIIHIFVEPLNVTYNRLLSGLEMRHIRKGHVSISKPLYRYWQDIMTTLWAFIPWVALIVTIAFSRHIRTKCPIWVYRIWQVLPCIGFLAFIILAIQGYMDSGYLKRRFLTQYSTALTLSLLITAIINIGLNREKRGSLNRLSLWIYLFIMPLTFVIASTNVYITHSFLAGGFWLCAALVVMVYLVQTSLHETPKKLSPPLWSGVAIIALAIIPFAGQSHLTHKPYRAKPMAKYEDTAYIQNGNKGTIKTDPITANLLNSMNAYYPLINAKGEPLYLIDLSGKHPFLNFHLGAKPLTVPWLFSTHKNSKEAFEVILSRLSHDEIATAWVIDTPDHKFRLEETTLNRYNINFPEDYDAVFKGASPFFKSDIILYRPKNSLD